MRERENFFRAGARKGMHTPYVGEKGLSIVGPYVSGPGAFLLYYNTSYSGRIRGSFCSLLWLYNGEWWCHGLLSGSRMLSDRVMACFSIVKAVSLRYAALLSLCNDTTAW